MDTELGEYMARYREKVHRELARLLQEEERQRQQYKLMCREMLAEYRSRHKSRTEGEQK